jgi:hypothetical protein
MEILAEGLNIPEGPLLDENGELWSVKMKAGKSNSLVAGKVDASRRNQTQWFVF